MCTKVRPCAAGAGEAGWSGDGFGPRIARCAYQRLSPTWRAWCHPFHCSMCHQSHPAPALHLYRAWGSVGLVHHGFLSVSPSLGSPCWKQLCLGSRKALCLHTGDRGRAARQPTLLSSSQHCHTMVPCKRTPQGRQRSHRINVINEAQASFLAFMSSNAEFFHWQVSMDFEKAPSGSPHLRDRKNEALM